jgi:ABC-type thiamine transport system ATPase subunit
MLRLEGVHKSFGALKVLRGVDLEVGRGAVVCVIGPSGSGKSTLLRCINLLEPPDDGRIRLEGKEITGGEEDLDYVRRRVGMVFQQFNLFPHKTALENVTLAQRTVLDREGADARAKGEALLARVGLSDKLDEYPRAPLRGPAAAGGDRAGAGDGPARDALRRGHQRARPGADQGGAGRDAGAGRRDDDGRGHPRDGLRRGCRRERASSSWTRE